jgi:hypothetical protein
VQAEDLLQVRASFVLRDHPPKHSGFACRLGDSSSLNGLAAISKVTALSGGRWAGIGLALASYVMVVPAGMPESQ